MIINKQLKISIIILAILLISAYIYRIISVTPTGGFFSNEEWLSIASSNIIASNIYIQDWDSLVSVGLWLFTIQILGFVFFPILHHFLYRLSDAGWIFSKFAGLVLLSYISWQFSALHILPFTRNSILLITTAIILLSICLIFRNKSEIWNSIYNARKIIIISEILFLVSFCVYCLYIYYGTGIYVPLTGAEHAMDSGILNAIVRSEWMPPHDPWLGGAYIHYYYFGFIPITTLIHLTKITPDISYSLGVAWTFACVSSMSFILTTTAIRYFSPNIPRALYVSICILSIFIITLTISPIAAIQQTIESFKDHYVLYENFYTNTLPAAENFHHFLLRNLHPSDTLFIPYFLFFIGYLLVLIHKLQCNDELKIIDNIICGVILGIALIVNIWSWIFCISVLFIFLGYYQLSIRGTHLIKKILKLLFTYLLVFSVSYLISLPLTHSLSVEIERVITVTGFVTDSYTFSIFTIAGLLTLNYIRKYLPIILSIPIVVLSIMIAYVLVLTPLFILSFIILAICFSFAIYHTLFKNKSSVSNLWVFLLVSLLIYFFISFIRLNYNNPRGIEYLFTDDSYTNIIHHCVLFASLLILWICAHIFSRSISNSKIITICIILLLGVLSFTAGETILSFIRYSDSKHSLYMTKSITSAPVYSITRDVEQYRAFPNRIYGDEACKRQGIRVNEEGCYIENSPYLVDYTYQMPEWRYPFRAHDGISNFNIAKEFEGIQWIQNNIQGNPIILESYAVRAFSYIDGGRVSSLTGIPTVYGSEYAVILQRPHIAESLKQRASDISIIYNSQSLEDIIPLLNKYNIQYVFVGAVENIFYPNNNWQEFINQQLISIDKVFDNGIVQVYKIGK